MAYESVNCNSLLSSLQNLSRKIPGLKSKLSNSINGLDDTNWKSEVRASTIKTVSKFDAKLDEINNSITSYIAIVGLISKYKALEQEIEGHRKAYKTYNSMYESLVNNPDSEEASSAADYERMAASELTTITNLEAELETRYKEIEGKSI